MPPYNLTKNETVQGQIQGLISKGSPLMTQAKTKAMEQANARGLANSSMAVQAGQAAVYDKALPIAQQDAQTYATSGLSEQEANQQKGLLSTEYGLKGKLSSQEAGQQKSLQGVIGQQAIDQIQEKGTQSKMLQDSAAQDASALSQQEFSQQKDIQGLIGQQKLDQQKLIGKQQLSQIWEQGQIQNKLAIIDGNINKQIQQMKNGASIQTANISANASKYATDIQEKVDTLKISSTEKANAGNQVSNLTNQFQTAMTNIQNDSSMDGPAKAAAIANAWQSYKTGTSAVETLYGVDLGVPDTFGVVT